MKNDPLKHIIPNPRTKFLRVKCNSCGNEQNVFSAPSSEIRCLVCNHKLAESTASKISLKAKVVNEFA